MEPSRQKSIFGETSSTGAPRLFPGSPDRPRVCLVVLVRAGQCRDVRTYFAEITSVCARILRDLPREERDLLRTAALLDTFDLDMLRAGCPNVPDSAVLRFKDRPFLELDPDRTWRYSLHTMLRDAIRTADTDLRDSWSPRERAEAAARIGAHLERVSTAAAAAGDRSTQFAAVRQAIELCVLTSQFFEWLVDGAQKLLTFGGWALLPDMPDGADGPIAALLLGLSLRFNLGLVTVCCHGR